MTTTTNHNREAKVQAYADTYDDLAPALEALYAQAPTAATTDADWEAWQDRKDTLLRRFARFAERRANQRCADWCTDHQDDIDGGWCGAGVGTFTGGGVNGGGPVDVEVKLTETPDGKIGINVRELETALTQREAFELIDLLRLAAVQATA